MTLMILAAHRVSSMCLTNTIFLSLYFGGLSIVDYGTILVLALFP